jgi:hypothetical protein
MYAYKAAKPPTFRLRPYACICAYSTAAFHCAEQQQIVNCGQGSAELIPHTSLHLVVPFHFVIDRLVRDHTIALSHVLAHLALSLSR